MCLQVCMCTQMHTDSFEDIYLSLVMQTAGDVEGIGIGYDGDDCVQ